MRPDSIAVTKIVDRNGTIVAQRRPAATRTIDADVADRLNLILERVIEQGTGRPAAIEVPAAGKTGTTEQRRDVWFVGYTPHPGLSAAVWIGHPPDENGNIPEMRTLHGRTVTGGGIAGRIWRLFMNRALASAASLEFRSVSLESPDP